MKDIKDDLVQLIRLALSEQTDDVRLFVARLVRKYRDGDPELVEQINLYLKSKPSKRSAILRKTSTIKNETLLPRDDESRLSLLKVFNDKPESVHPLLSNALEDVLGQLILERKQVSRLASLGLDPTRSAIFVGKPGVGKTLTARWLAAQLNLPLYVLDLTAVMSSLLGRSGSNIRAALDFAKSSPCILLLDEIDSIAKRRSDDSDVGELKRLVTVILQELDEWPAEGLLLAATNHPELIDPALWRRFDVKIEFELPDTASIKEAIKHFSAHDYPLLSRWSDILAFAFEGESFSDIERSIQRFRRALALGTDSDADMVEEFIKSRAVNLDRQKKIEFSVLLAKHTRFSQHAISDITGVSRDTIRKHLKEEKPSERDVK